MRHVRALEVLRELAAVGLRCGHHQLLLLLLRCHLRTALVVDVWLLALSLLLLRLLLLRLLLLLLLGLLLGLGLLLLLLRLLLLLLALVVDGLLLGLLHLCELGPHQLRLVCLLVAMLVLLVLLLMLLLVLLLHQVLLVGSDILLGVRVGLQL